MEFTILFENIEMELPLVSEENDIDLMMDILKTEFKPLITNAKILKYFGIDLNYGR